MNGKMGDDGSDGRFFPYLTGEAASRRFEAPLVIFETPLFSWSPFREGRTLLCKDRRVLKWCFKHC